MRDLHRLMMELDVQMQEMTQLIDNVRTPRCLRCGKKLTDDMSKFRGYGPVCWERLIVDRQEKLF